MTKSIERIRREHALLLESIEVTSTPFAVFDNQDRLIAWNQSYETIHAQAFSALRAKSEQPLFRYSELLRAVAEQAERPGKVEEYVRKQLEAHRKADGTALDRYFPGAGWFRVTEFKTRGGGVASFAIDINENKRREAELEREIRRRMALEEQLRVQATTDSLTQLANRRAFLERAENDFRRVQRYGDDLSVVMMDADLFKQVNDLHGHAVGDAVLIGIARTAEGAIRSFDLVGRMGGEEFAIILVHTAIDDAAACAERIRSGVEALVFESPNGPVKITASFGVAQSSESDESFSALLNRADRALYRAKEGGRNRIAVDRVGE